MKSIWVKVIKEHAKPVREVFYELAKKNKNGNQSGWFTITCAMSDCGNIFSFTAKKVRLDSDDFLILYFDEKWVNGEKESIRYVPWEYIMSIEFEWKIDY